MKKVDTSTLREDPGGGIYLAEKTLRPALLAAAAAGFLAALKLGRVLRSRTNRR